MTTNYTIRATATIFDFDSRNEARMEDVLEFIESHDAIIEESDWRDDDNNWPESDRHDRTVVTLTPTRDGCRDELSQWVLVIE